jgi:hypothetical protein
VCGVENLLQDSFRATLEMNDFAPAIVRRFASLDPAVLLEPVEQTGEGWLFNAHPLGDFLLGKLVPTLREVNKCPPLALAQAKRAQTLIEPCPPGPSGPEKQKTKLIGIGWRHARNIG